MDPLSLSAGLFTFIGAAITTLSTSKTLINDINDAFKEVSQLARETDELRKVFEKIKTLEALVAQHPEELVRQAGLSVAFIQGCSKDLHDLKIIVEALHHQLKGTRTSRARARIRWALKTKSRVNECTQKIQGHKTSLILAFGNLNSSISLHTLEKVSCVGESVSTTKIENDGHFNALRTIIGKSASGVDSLVQASSITKEMLEDFQTSLTTIDLRLKESHPIQDRVLTLSAPCHMIPYPQNVRFFGRTKLLSEIGTAINPRSTTPPKLRSLALYGMPGVGKTQSALRYVYQHLEVYRVVLWISADTEEKILQGFADAAKQLGLDTSSNDQLERFKEVKKWLMVTDEQWLLVYDNADDLSIMQQYWPTAHNGAVLITSRSPVSMQGVIEAGLEVTPFHLQDSTDLLLSLLQSESTSNIRPKAEQIVTLLGHLPLAIDQMASFIRESKCSLSGFLDIYTVREKAFELHQIPGAPVPWYTHTVATSFDLSLQKLSRNASVTLDILGFLHPDEIPEAILEDKNRSEFLNDSLTRHTIVKDLRRLSLINSNEDKHTFSLHRLVRDAALRNGFGNGERQNLAFNHVVRLLNNAFPHHCPFREHMTELWGPCEIYLPHVLSVHEHYTKMVKFIPHELIKNFTELLYNCSWYLFERGRFEKSFEIAKTAQELCERTDLGDYGLLLADIYMVQGAMHIELTHDDEATDLFKKSRDLREGAVTAGMLDPAHPNRANSFMNLGVSVANKDPKKAIEFHQRAIEIREGSSKYTKEQVQTLSLNYLNIGRCWWMVGNPENATESFEKCIAVIEPKEKSSNVSFVQKSWAWSALGNVLIDQGKLSEAFTYCTKSMESVETILGTTHLKTAACYYKVAWLFHKQGDLQRARDLLKLALDVYSTKDEVAVRGEIARTKFKLSAVMQDAGMADEASKEKTTAEALRCSITGQDADTTATEEDYDKLVAYFYR